MASEVLEPSSQGSESQIQQQQGMPSRSKLVQRLLDATANLPAFINNLLTTQAIVVAGTEAAGFIIEKGDEKFSLRPIAHIRPDESDASTRAAAMRAFQELVNPCITQNKDGAIEVGSPDGGEPQFCLVTLLRNEGMVVAASAVITRCRDVERARQRLGSMQLVAGYFELWTLRQTSEQARMLAQRHQDVLQYASAVSTAEGFESAAMNLCNEIGNRVEASRVSLGWVKGRQVKVRALSHTEKFDKKQDLIVQLERVMEECLDQEEPVKYDPNGSCSPNVSRNARSFSQQQGGPAVLSLPLRHREDIEGILTIEFPPQRKLEEHTEAGLSVSADLLAPQLFDRHENDRYLIVKVGHSIRDVGKLLIGPKHMVAKLVVVLVAAAAAFITFYKPTYHVDAAFQLIPTERRMLCAPFDGYLKDVKVKPGQAVKKGEILARFDTTQKEAELTGAQAQVRRKEAEIRQYGADPKKEAERAIAEAERDQAQAQVNLLTDQIDRGLVKAPFDGVLLKGDLVDFQDTPKKEGEVLFEFARRQDGTADRVPIEAEMAVSEKDIQEVRQMMENKKKDPKADHNQDGELATSALPNQSFKLRITRVVPAGEAKEGENVFKIYADVVDPPAWMHPGLQGEAKIAIEKRRLVWTWTHRVIDFVRLKLWI